MTSRRHPNHRPAADAFRSWDPSPPRDRLEALLGTDMTRLLLNALAAGTTYRDRPERGRGLSSP